MHVLSHQGLGLEHPRRCCHTPVQSLHASAKKHLNFPPYLRISLRSNARVMSFRSAHRVEQMSPSKGLWHGRRQVHATLIGAELAKHNSETASSRLRCIEPLHMLPRCMKMQSASKPSIKVHAHCPRHCFAIVRRGDARRSITKIRREHPPPRWRCHTPSSHSMLRQRII